MIYFITGVIVGLLLALLTAILNKSLKTPVERFINQTSSKLKRTGLLLDPAESEVEDWIKEVEQ